MSPDVGRAFGTVITVGAGVIALDMVSRFGETTRKDKRETYTPAFTLKNMPSRQFSFKPIKWRL